MATARPCIVDRDLDAPYRLGYTGGTTGKSKAVTLTTRGELSELSAFLTDLVPDIGPDDTFLHAAPIAHASGAFFLPSLVRGARSVVMAKFDPAGFVHLAERERAGLTFLVPTMLAMILEQPETAKADFALRRIAYGAAPIAPALLARAEARFGRVFAQTYGQAESPMVITCLKPEDHDRVGSCGQPFTIVEYAARLRSRSTITTTWRGSSCISKRRLWPCWNGFATTSTSSGSSSARGRGCGSRWNRSGWPATGNGLSACSAAISAKRSAWRCCRRGARLEAGQLAPGRRPVPVRRRRPAPDALGADAAGFAAEARLALFRGQPGQQRLERRP